MKLRLLAPAKLNLSLEVIGKRDDGYHEVVTVMQTIDLADKVSVSTAQSLDLFVSGPEAGGAPEAAAENLAYRAAVALREAAGSASLGARIELEKHIPAAAGLGGGSSDAAAVLRGLNRLWSLGFDTAALSGIAAALGSDVPFFLHGGSAIATGRGEEIEHLSDFAPADIVLFTSDMAIEDKTRRMYGALKPTDFTQGDATRALVAGPFSPDRLYNAFDHAVANVAPGIGDAMALCRDAGVRVISAGAGPSFFATARPDELPPGLVEKLSSHHGVRVRQQRFLSAAEALEIIEG